MSKLLLPCERCGHDHEAEHDGTQVTRVDACEHNSCSCGAEDWVLEGEEVT